MLALAYLTRAIPILTLVMFILVIGNICLVKRKKINKQKAIACSIFILYICCVIVVTLGYRTNQGYLSENFIPLFASFREAYMKKEIGLWINIFLNICLFIPFGFLFSMIFPKVHHPLVVYMIGFGGTVTIEMLQYMLGFAPFECDDLLTNTCGCIVGYSGYRMTYKRRSLREKNRAIMTIGIMIIPYVIVHIAYMCAPFGYIGSTYYWHPIQINEVVWNADIPVRENEPIWKVSQYTKETTAKYGKRMMNVLGITPSFFYMPRVEPGGVILKSLHSKVARMTLCQDGLIGSIWINDEKYAISIDSEGTLQTIVTQIFANTGTVIPKGISPVRQDFISYAEDIIYLWTFPDYVVNGMMYSGYIDCQISETGYLKNVHMGLKTMDKVCYCTYLNEDNLRDVIYRGEIGFVESDVMQCNQLIIDTCEIVYLEDTKGFYRPVYKINGNADGVAVCFYVDLA